MVKITASARAQAQEDCSEGNGLPDPAKRCLISKKSQPHRTTLTRLS